MNISDIIKLIKAGDLKKSHTSWTRGYMSRKQKPYIVPYKGKFGDGYAVYSPSWKSTRYHYVTYFITQ